MSDNQRFKILDTNVLLDGPDAFFAFKPPRKDIVTTVVVPVGVLYELDSFKDEVDRFSSSGLTERAHKARIATNVLKEIRQKYHSNLNEGICVEQGYILESSFEIEKQMNVPLEQILTREDTDNRLLKICYWLKSKGFDVELITSDGPLLNIADSLAIAASPWKDYDKRFKIDVLYKGWREIELDASLVGMFYKQHSLPVSLTGYADLKPNEFVFTKKSVASAGGLVGMYNAQREAIVPLVHYENKKSPINAMYREQRFLMDALRNPEIDIVFAFGIAGCGKTFLAVDAGFEQCIQPTVDSGENGESRKAIYQKLLITRPIIPHKGQHEVGYLPGTLEEKVAPWVAPIHDQCDILFHMYAIQRLDAEELYKQNLLEVQLLSTMRGRNYPNMFWIVDEGQNFSYDSYETIMTRGADGLKLVITGDPSPSQTDLKVSHGNPLLFNNMLMRNDPKTATVYFEDERCCVRGDIPRRYLEAKKQFESERQDFRK